MTRLLVLLTALLFILGFAVLTIHAIAEQGLTAAAVISILILVLLAVGILGALRHPPR
ncbi:MAG TPA: hypothetical protein VN772_07030 [Solirubrobacteraceae bacterium]|nr:hypothetical protein [Solirubrobacteraceae bacterium]